MIYSLSKLYDTKVLNRNKIVTEDIEPPVTSNDLDLDNVVSLLSTALKQIIELSDNANQIDEELIDQIRSISISALIDSGIEKD